MMLKLISFVLLCVSIYSPLAGQEFPYPGTDVSIIFVWQQDMFPPNWEKAPVCAEALDLSKPEFKRSRAIAYRAMGKYPKSLFDRNLSRVYFVSLLAFYNMTYGGSNAADRIYLTNDGQRHNYSDEYIERLFHAEFSSVLLRNHRQHFDIVAWKALAPGDFSYGKGGREALATGSASELWQTKNYEKGFLSEYGQSSIENDFNSFAKQMFCPSANWQELLHTYPTIKAKYLRMLNFYQQLDPLFTEAYFEKLWSLMESK